MLEVVNRKALLIVISVILGIALVVIGCAQPAPSPSPAPAPSPAPTSAPAPTASPKPAPSTAPAPSPTAAPVKPIELKFHNHFAPAAFGNTGGVDPWIKLVQEKTGGKVKITNYPGSTLMKGTSAWEGTVSGIADISVIFVGYFPGQFSLSEAVTLPMLGIDTAESGSKIAWQLYSALPEIQQEWAGVKTLALFTTDPYDLWTVKKQVKTMDDIKGLKIRAPAGPATEAMKALGAVPLLTPMEESYINLQKGVIDGIGSVAESTQGFRFYEVCKYAVSNSNMYLGLFAIGMNKDKWNSLPPDAQKAIEGVSYEYGSAFFGKGIFDGAVAGMMDTIKKEGFLDKITFTNLEPAELDRWKTATAPVRDSWATNIEAKGKPGKKVLEQLNKLLK